MKMILLLLPIMFLASCQRADMQVQSKRYDSYFIDTITIHGVEHEFIIKCGSKFMNGICHSPECSCLKRKDN